MESTQCAAVATYPASTKIPPQINLFDAEKVMVQTYGKSNCVFDDVGSYIQPQSKPQNPFQRTFAGTTHLRTRCLARR